MEVMRLREMKYFAQNGGNQVGTQSWLSAFLRALQY